jgi:hypothetical protein
MQESLGKPEAAPLRGAGARANAAAGGKREPTSRKSRIAAIFAYLDVIVVLVATPPALILGAPLFGFLVGAIAWLLQRLLARVDKLWIGRRTEPRTQLGLNLFEAFGRIWLLAGAIVIAGVVGDRADGLTAALVIFGAYSVAFAIKVLSGLSADSTDDPPARSAAAANRIPERAAR